MPLEQPGGIAPLGPEAEPTPDQKRIAELETDNMALRQRNEALEEKVEALEKLAFMDALTETFNRHGLEKMIKVLLPPDRKEELEKRESRIPITVTLVDLDNFKKFNDTHGHPEGDEVLRQAANVLKGFLRGNDIVARYGGEEFLIIHSNTTVEDIKKRILDESTGHLKINFIAEVKGEEVPISFSGGMTAVRPEETVKDFPAIVKRADDALYQSKRAGKNRITHIKEESIAGEDSEKSL